MNSGSQRDQEFSIEHDYRSKDEILEIFDSPESQNTLAKMIDGYDQKKEGMMVLVTDYSNASYFVTVKLRL